MLIIGNSTEFIQSIYMSVTTEEQLYRILQDRDIKPTAMRILVLRQLAVSDQTLTLRELEELLHPADRSTIFRTLSVFEEHHVVHAIDDGSGATRYELCHAHHSSYDNDLHPHFRCLRCGQTICMTELQMPAITLPEGYHVHRINYIVTGICANCTKSEEI